MKTPYEVLFGAKPSVKHFRAFGCPCTLLHLDATPKFDAKADECYFVRYAGKTAYRVYNKQTKQIVESFDVRWLEENEADARVGPDWLFDYDTLFRSFRIFDDVSSGVNTGSTDSSTYAAGTSSSLVDDAEDEGDASFCRTIHSHYG